MPNNLPSKLVEAPIENIAQHLAESLIDYAKSSPSENTECASPEEEDEVLVDSWSLLPKFDEDLDEEGLMSNDLPSNMSKYEQGMEEEPQPSEHESNDGNVLCKDELHERLVVPMDPSNSPTTVTKERNENDAIDVGIEMISSQAKKATILFGEKLYEAKRKKAKKNILGHNTIIFSRIKKAEKNLLGHIAEETRLAKCRGISSYIEISMGPFDLENHFLGGENDGGASYIALEDVHNMGLGSNILPNNPVEQFSICRAPVSRGKPALAELLLAEIQPTEPLQHLPNLNSAEILPAKLQSAEAQQHLPNPNSAELLFGRTPHLGQVSQNSQSLEPVKDFSPEEIDSWVQLALARRVQFIELDLTSFHSCIEPSIEYDFPIRSHCGFQSLKSLVLNNVNISGDDLESLVDKCSNLEDLNVSRSNSIEVFKLSSPSLKQLTLWLCDPLLDTKISAPNLLSFAWTGSENSNLLLQNVPHLKYVRISCYRYYIQSHHSQLVKLELDDMCATDPQIQWTINIPELYNLIHLTMKHEYFDDDHTFCLIAAYLKVAPLLETFTLEVYTREGDANLSEATLNTIENHCYKNLKSVEFKGFGETQDVEFIKYLLIHAPLLEKIVIDPCPPNYLRSPAEIEHTLSTKYLEARDLAINFSASLDCHVTVV